MEDQDRDVRRIRVIKDGPVGEIRLSEPEVFNAMGYQWPDDMLAAAREVRDDPEIRVVLLTGEGRSFCSGLNLTQLGRGEIPRMNASRTAGRPKMASSAAMRTSQAMATWSPPPMQWPCRPAITGFSIVSIARKAYSLSWKNFSEMSMYRLPRVIPMAHARHLILSGENIDAQEAYRIGLVNKVVPRADLKRELEAWTQRYLEVPRPSIEWSKRLSNKAYDLTFEQFLEEFDRAVDAMISSEEHQIARREWMELKGYGPSG